MSTETNSQERKQKAKRIAKNVGKGLLTLVSPPIGLATFYKEKDRAPAIFIGLAASAFTSVASIGAMMLSQNVLYDNPRVVQEARPNNLARTIPEVFISPWAFILDSHIQTSVNPDESSFVRAYRNNVITFDSESGRYGLNFNENTKFDTNNFGRYSSLAEAEQAIERARTKGNVIKAREAATTYQQVSKDYEKVRGIFADAIDKMNSELNGLEPKAKGEQK